MSEIVSTHASQVNSNKYRWLMLISLCLSAFAVIICNRSFWIGMLIDQQIILVGPFGASLVTNLYPSMLLSSLVLYGVLANRFNKKTTLQAALLLYSMALAIAFFLVKSIFVFAFLLIIMGIAAGAILSITCIYVVEILQHQKSRIGYIGYGLCILIGIFIRDLTGFLDFNSRNIIFTVIIALITCFIVNYKLIQKNKGEAGTKINLVSVILTITMVVFLTFTINEAPMYPFYQYVLLFTLAIALIAFVFLLLWEKQSHHPLFRDFHFSISGFIAGTVTFISFFLVSSIPYLMEHYFILTNEATDYVFSFSVIMISSAILILGVSIWLLARKYTSKSLITFGLALVGLVLISMFMWTDDIKLPLLYVLIVFILLGALCSFVGVVMLYVDAVRGKVMRGEAVASNFNIYREMGSIVGFSFIGLTQRLIYNMNSTDINNELPQYVQSIVQISYTAGINSIKEYSDNADVLLEKLKENWIMAYDVTMLITGALALIMAYIVYMYFKKNVIKTNK